MSNQEVRQSILAELDNFRLDNLRQKGKASENNHFHIPVSGGTEVHTEETVFLGEAIDSEWELIYRKNGVFTNILIYQDQYENKQIVTQHFEGTKRSKENLKQAQGETN